MCTFTLSGIMEKKAVAKELGIWFVQPDAADRLSSGAHWEEVILREEKHVGTNFTLPCGLGVAGWSR